MNKQLQSEVARIREKIWAPPDTFPPLTHKEKVIYYKYIWSGGIVDEHNEQYLTPPAKDMQQDICEL